MSSGGIGECAAKRRTAQLGSNQSERKWIISNCGKSYHFVYVEKKVGNFLLEILNVLHFIATKFVKQCFLYLPGNQLVFRVGSLEPQMPLLSINWQERGLSR